MTTFPEGEAHSRWSHEFYRGHDDVVQSLRHSVAHDVLEFHTDPAIFERLSDDGE